MNTSLIELQNDYILEGKINDDEFSEYFDEYNAENESVYQEFSKAYLTIYRNKKLREKVSQVINHPVKLDIHKRWDLFDAFSQNDDISLKDKMLKKFIEIILIHGLDEINKVFIHSFVSLKDIKMKSGNTNEIVLTMKDIRDDLHIGLFISKSSYIRDISYYDEYNPDIHKRFLRKEYNTKHVSFETKYPNSLRRLFTRNIKVLKNIVSEETDDFKLLEQALINIDTSYNDVYLRELLVNSIKENKEAYKYENLLLDNRYKSNDELLIDLEDPNYLITSYDFKLLSKELGVGHICIQINIVENRLNFKCIL